MSTPTELRAAFSLAAVLFAVGTVIPIVTYLTLAGTEARKWLAGLTLITAVPVLTYGAAALGIGTLERGGELVFASRWVSWLVTTPLLIGYVAYVAGASRQVILTLSLVDTGMIAAGGIGAALAGIAGWLAFGIGAVCHLVLVGTLYGYLPGQVPDDPRRLGFFTLLKHHIGLLWFAYPFLWLVSPVGFGVVTPVGAALSYTFLDLIAKIPYVYFFYERRALFSDETDRAESAQTPATPAD